MQADIMPSGVSLEFLKNLGGNLTLRFSISKVGICGNTQNIQNIFKIVPKISIFLEEEFLDKLYIVNFITESRFQI